MISLSNCAVCLGASSITKKLQDLLPVLISCFQEIFPLVCRMPSVETQTFDCMLSILQSINHTVKFFVYKMNKPHASHGYSMHKEPNMTSWGESSIPVLLKFFEAFPLNRVHQSTEKVRSSFFFGCKCHFIASQLATFDDFVSIFCLLSLTC